MKNAAIVVATGALVATLAACGSGSSSTSSNAAGSGHFGSCKVSGTADSISLKTQTPGVLTVATVLPNPGWWNGSNPPDVNSGFEYCLAADIAHQAGLKSVAIKNLAWDQYISGSATGYDIGIASTTITPARKQVFDFSSPYFPPTSASPPRLARISPRRPSRAPRSVSSRATSAHSGLLAPSSPPSSQPPSRPRRTCSPRWPPAKSTR